MPRREPNEAAAGTIAFGILYENRGKIISSAHLTEKLNVSRQAVNKIMNALRDDGLPVESVPQKGYILGDIDSCDSLSPALIEYFMKDCAPFHRFIFLHETESTQKIIKKYAQAGEDEGLAAAADLQTEGRGRRGRSWAACAGKNLTFSLLLRPNLKTGEVQLLNLAAGMAVKKTLCEATGLPFELKWPNDILRGGRKICGILSEAAGEPDKIYYAVTGIGLNINMESKDILAELAGMATSLMIETGRKWARWKLLIGILKNFAGIMDALSQKDGAAVLIDRYRRECDTIGRRVRIIQDEETICGKAVDVTREGALVAETDTGMRSFTAADVQHLRLAKEE